MPRALLEQRRETAVRTHMEAENSRDFDAALATFRHPRYELVGTQQTFDGPEEVRGYYEETRTAFPDQHNEIVAMHHARDAVIVEFWLEGTHRGPIMGIAPTGRRFRARMVAVFEFVGAAIACERVYFDAGTIRSQLVDQG